jgi:hypothetical protein
MPRVRKRYRMTPPMENQLLGISARQIDRRLQAKKSERKRRIYGRTQPGSLLKHHIEGAVGVRAAVAPVAFREEVHSEDESRISEGSRCSGKTRSASSASLPAPPCDSAYTLPGNIPTRLCVPIEPSSNPLLSRVTSYVSRRPPLGLHLAWLDTAP